MKAGLAWLTAGLVVAVGVGAATGLWPETQEGHAEPSAGAAFTAGIVSELGAEFEDRRAPSLSGAWRLSLPEDHAPHPEAPAETWSVVAHLDDEDGTPVTVLVTLSRFGIAAGAEDAGNAWAPRDAWLGQAALVGAEVGAEERLSRGVGAAGQDAAAGLVWLDDWALDHGRAAGADLFSLRARVEGLPLDLTLRPVKAAVAPGEGTDGPARGFALPRLEVSGETGGRTVDGVAWMDRLWGDLPAPGGPLVYDRMILHLDDGTDISVLRTRRRDGRGGATLDGVLVGGGGAALPLADGAEWHGGRDEGTWTLTAPGLDLVATARPGAGLRDFAVPVWHAGLEVEGTRDGHAVRGRGSLLLTPETGP